MGIALEMGDNIWPGSRKEEKKRKTRNEVRKGCEENDESEESNTWRRRNRANMEKNDREPDIGATLENCYRQNYSIVSVDRK